jgi:FKBP12-rapamycin complex-associated protein
MNDIQKNIGNLISSSNANEKISGIIAIGIMINKSRKIYFLDELIDIDYDENENANKISKFGQLLRRILESTEGQVLLAVPKPLGKSQKILRMLTKSSGHLIRSGGTTQTAETVDIATQRAFESLAQDKSADRRHAGVLILKELAINAPTLFNVHVPNFVVQIWTALNDPLIQIRESGVEAIRACLDVVAERQNNMRSEWYRKLYAEAIKVTHHL